MEGGKDWLEAILKRKAYAESPVKVLELDDGGSAPGKGENYLSKIRKIRAKVLLGSGRIRHDSFIVKCQHETEYMKIMSVDMFVREIAMYRDVLPKMQQLLEDFDDQEGIFWAQCYDIRVYNRLVFEDLGDSGFRNANRLKQLSLNAVLMSVKYFAKFHALSKVLLDRGEIPKEMFAKNVWTTTPEEVEISKNMINASVKRVCEIMGAWGDEWREATERLKAVNLGELHMREFNAKPDDFNVLSHCDAWTNNMMFGGENLENPTSLRLVDFQLCSLNTPAKDVAQLMTTSVRLEDREQNTDLIVETYADALKLYLIKFGYTGDIPTLDDIKRSLERKAVGCLSDAIGFVPIILADAEHAPDLEQAMKEHHEAMERGEEGTFDGFNIHENLTPIAESIIKYQIKEAMKSGLI